MMALAPAARKSDVRVLLISDHTIVRAGIRSLIEKQPGMTVVGEVRSCVEDLENIQERPDVILIDLDSGSDDYLESVVQTMQPAHALALTSSHDPEVYHRIARLGCMGVVLKDKPVEVLLKAIQKVYAGEIWFERSTMAGVIREIGHRRGSQSSDEDAARIGSLTKRERDVINLLCEGLRPPQIAERLFISETTVRHHLTSIYNKLDVVDRFDLVFYAYKHKLGTPPK